MSYAELTCISNFTFQYGASHAQELVRRAKQLNYAALAITDECSLAGIVRAHEAAVEEKIPLIVGSYFRCEHGRLVLLVPSQDAYTQLCELITRCRRAASKGSYVISPDDVRTSVSHCFGIWLPDEITDKHVDESSLTWFKSLNLSGHYLGCTHHLQQHADEHLRRLIQLADEAGITPLAVGDVHYHVRERRVLHDVLTAIRLGTTVDRIGKQGFANGERHLRSISTLKKLFPESLLSNTLQVASRCTFSMNELRYEYPHELVPQGITATQHLRALTLAGIQHRWPQGIPDAVLQLIEKELALIAELQYEHFFLTVEDMVRFARSKGILCQGRGSAANSAVCYTLGITEVDPARSNLLFERFISKERAEPPDIDVDFEHDRREEVIQYVYQKYGRARAALAATVICYKRRMAIRDVGKALGLAPDVVDALAKSMQWFEGNLPKELKRVGFDPASKLARQLATLVNELIGFPRHLSQHVGGFVISDHPLSTLVPLENAAMPDRTIIQWDKEDLETLGLLKVDCLALGMLSAIRRALAMISKYKQRPFCMQDIPAEDKSTYDMLSRAESVGVFQVESRAQMSMLPRLKPQCFYDLVIQIAIVRPGPIQGGMVHPYLKRRQGLEAITYPSEALQAVLSRTCGVPLFQEQVMQIAIVAAGFTPGEADKVRRSMAAWQRRGGLEHFREQLINGMLQRGYQPQFAEQIYQQILGFGSYGFPESHAASFALLAYASAWLRCHEPAAFCAALLNSYPMGFYAPAQLIADARRNGVCFRPVDVNYSEWECTLQLNEVSQPEVRIGLNMIKGINEQQAKAIVQARAQHMFDNVDDLAHRAVLNRHALSALSKAGALTSLVPHRYAAQWNTLGVERLPGLLAGHSATETSLHFSVMSEGREIVADYQSTGFTLKRHPLALLRERLQQLKVTRAKELATVQDGRQVRVAGIVTHRQRPQTAAGVMFVSLEDETGCSNIIVWQQVQQAQRQSLLQAQLMIVQGKLQNAHGVIHVVAHKIRDYSHWLGELHLESRDFR